MEFQTVKYFCFSTQNLQNGCRENASFAREKLSRGKLLRWMKRAKLAGDSWTKMYLARNLVNYKSYSINSEFFLFSLFFYRLLAITG